MAILYTVGWQLLCVNMRGNYPLAVTKRAYMSSVRGSGHAWLRDAIGYHIRSGNKDADTERAVSRALQSVARGIR
jgi:hypothetical protein